MEKNNILKLRPSVAVVIHEDVTEFFLSNIRKSIHLKINPQLSRFLFELTGNISIQDFFESKGLNHEQQDKFLQLLTYLNSVHILLNEDCPYNEDYKDYPRVFSLLEDFYSSKSEINAIFRKIKNSRVMIVGLGAVGTWVSQSLLMDGVQNFILVDPDKVEISNLHRQIGFTEKSIGTFKVDAFSEYLKTKKTNVNITRVKDWLDETFFEKYQFSNIDLIIKLCRFSNC